RFSVLFMKQRMQPEFVATMSFFDAGGGAAIAAVAGGTAELLRIVNLKQLFAGMADKSPRQIVRTFSGTAGRHVRSLNGQRLTRAEMANFASIDNAGLVNVNLMAEDGVIEVVLVLSNQIVDVLSRQN